MAHIVYMGAGIGGMPMAYEIGSCARRDDKRHGDLPHPRFHFVPATVGGRQLAQRARTSRSRSPLFEAEGHRLQPVGAKRVHPAENRIELDDGSSVAYDYLVIATGPEARVRRDRAWALPPRRPHPVGVPCRSRGRRREGLAEFVEDPGPIVVGAVQGASCFGPAYEFAMIMDTDLRRRKIRDKVPMTFVTAEPYVGHLGLGGVGDSKGLLESAMRDRHIKWITNAKTTGVEAGKVTSPSTTSTARRRAARLPFKYSMMLPAFKGIDAVFGIEGLTNPRGFILIDVFQRNPKFTEHLFGRACAWRFRRSRRRRCRPARRRPAT